MKDPSVEMIRSPVNNELMLPMNMPAGAKQLLIMRKLTNQTRQPVKNRLGFLSIL
jgi:hypothetical protein